MKTTEKLNDAGSINIESIKKLIMMQKLEPRTVGLKPIKIRQVNRVIVPSIAYIEDHAKHKIQIKYKISRTFQHTQP